MPNEQPVFNQIDLVVRDASASAAFYRKLGIPFPDLGPEDHGDEHLPNGMTFHLDSPWLAERFNASWRAGTGTQVLLGFSVASRDAVDDLYRELTEDGHPGVQPPYDTFWGARYAIVADPDGNQVGIMSPVGQAPRTLAAKGLAGSVTIRRVRSSRRVR